MKLIFVYGALLMLLCAVDLASATELPESEGACRAFFPLAGLKFETTEDLAHFISQFDETGIYPFKDLSHISTNRFGEILVISKATQVRVFPGLHVKFMVGRELATSEMEYILRNPISPMALVDGESMGFISTTRVVAKRLNLEERVEKYVISELLSAGLEVNPLDRDWQSPLATRKDSSGILFMSLYQPVEQTTPEAVAKIIKAFQM